MALQSFYLTVAELLNAPLGLDLKNIPASGSTGSSGVKAAENYAELVNIIMRASSMMDTHCRQILGATTDSEEVWTQTGRKAGIDKSGYLWLFANFNPIVSVSSFQYGYPQVGGTSWTIPSASDVMITGPQKNKLIYPGMFERFNTPPIIVQVTYVNGYPNTLLDGSTKVSAGATSIPVKDCTGMIAGSKLWIYDQGNTELVTVASTWVQSTGAANVDLASATLFDHSPVPRATATAGQQIYDISVSALPPEVKQAALLVVKSIVEKRGTNALVMGKTGGTSGKSSQEKQTEEFPPEADDILIPFKRWF